MGWKFFDDVKRFFNEKLPQTFNTVVGKVKELPKQAGNFFNTVHNTAEDIYGKIKKIPVLGDVISKSPIGSFVDTGLGVLGNASNLMNQIDKGNFKEALQQGGNIAQQIGMGNKYKNVLNNAQNIASKFGAGKIIE